MIWARKIFDGIIFTISFLFRFTGYDKIKRENINLDVDRSRKEKWVEEKTSALENQKGGKNV